MPPRNIGGIASRINKLSKLIYKKNWTLSSVDSDGVVLNIHWYKKNYRPLAFTTPSNITETF